MPLPRELILILLFLFRHSCDGMCAASHFLGHSAKRDICVLQTAFDRLLLVIIQRSVSLALWAAAAPTALANRVGIIFGRCTKEQMIRAYASWYVTGMAHKQSIGNGAVVEFPRIAVRIRLMFRVPGKTVPRRCRRFCPQPAGGSFVDMCPKRISGFFRFAPIVRKATPGRTESSTSSCDIGCFTTKLLIADQTNATQREASGNSFHWHGESFQLRIISDYMGARALIPACQPMISRP